MSTLQEQYEAAIGALSAGDIDALTKILTNPQATTPAENRTVAERLGFKGGFLNAIVDIAADPTVWVATLMSRRFPTRAWLTGAIPTRFIGHANEFTGVSQYTRPIETYFRGTNIPRLTALAEHRRAEVMKVGQRLHAHSERPNWQTEKATVSLLLEGQPAPGATPELRRLADSIRGDMAEMWGFLKQTQKVTGGFDGTEIVRAGARPFAPHEAPRYLRDYLPHIPLVTDEAVMTVSARDAMQKLGMGKLQQTFAAVGENPLAVWKPDQIGRLTSDFARYQTMLNNVRGQVWNQHLFLRQRDVPINSMLGQQLFITDLDQIFAKYTSAVARTYAINAPLSQRERILAATRIRDESGAQKTLLPSAEPIAVQIINEGLDAAGARFIERPIPGTSHRVQILDPTSTNPLMLTGLRHLTRAVSGRLQEGEIVWGNMFASVGRHFDETVGRATNKQKAEVDAAMRAMQRNRSFRNVSNGITSYFHSTTLGMNPWSAIQNLFQPLLTTAPAVGVGPTLAGMKELGRRMPRYASELRRQHGILRDRAKGPLNRLNEAADKAFESVFPELAASGIRPDIRHYDINPGSIAEGRMGKAFRNYDEFAKFILQPFNHAELANQVTTFYAGREALKREMRLGTWKPPVDPTSGAPLSGSLLDDWMNFEAGQIVNATQFRPGPGGRSIWQGNVPSFVRQFTAFPTRALSFMMESTVRGAMVEKEIEAGGLLAKVTGGRNLGTIARMYLYGRLAQEGAREVLGVDLGNVLGVTSPFTVAPPGQVFAPYSAPPIATTVAGIVSAAANRDIKELRPITIPGVGDVPIPKTLIPGGVGMGRMLRAIHMWEPDVGGFVDENRRLMYRGNSADFIAAMIGVPLDKNRRLRNEMEQTQQVRATVNRIRREFALARINVDTGAQMRLQAEWAETFPDWPPLTVSERDLNRYRQAARIPALQRMLQTMGASGRYLQEEIYEVDPELLAPPDVGLMRAG